MALKKVRIQDAVGMVLGHDMTKIVPGEYKGPAFKKGHIIQKEDIPHLLNIGKEHIYLFELGEGQLHENEAAERLAAAVGGTNTFFKEPSEGKVQIVAKQAGLLKVNREAVTKINSVNYIVLSTLHSNLLVKKDEPLAGVKAIPLIVDRQLVEAAEKIAGEYQDIVAVKPLQSLKTGIITTGNEVFYGRIQDRFGPVLQEKIATYQAVFSGITFQPDNAEKISQAIMDYVHDGVEIIIVTGGMSVDPDDVTPDAIRATGAEVITYGTPVLPGAMFMLAYLDKIAILGLPACGMFSKITVLDLVFPRILAGERLTKQDFAEMGYGGLCKGCEECVYPHCPFGK
ncbi:molybdopterin-binding protein [Sporomusa acidovorans]|uniref:Molybdopterin molybdenumtransferase n=1 Tax=Sporomusa acidovorans (strain ATCC 49682 / DSM 3132 / Mol) TaxID=1123286 RepID=A0ABZ3J109_SPOA4|nr:molybdopterin-binding protein [Sporomusa acidovorans]OZC22458.1 putative competence-damage inducible protein [Sporomusa acidovorans DSM 3132]SDE74397.1 molybdenum cofactor synthesis domain-containing protein [Sporomusa acidovorans]